MRPTFKETLGKLYITEKLMKYKRNVLKVFFFSQLLRQTNIKAR